ncbi:hypothetical protein ADK67_17800 [Saccharothrix sp. NRRL B-16348]|jgi:hypothetical protein|uniref:DUF6292 family protein n=1 Tax=Saccharothrix sp. NRRL B-16348 TaxID=1415542 RepID=UPI0006AFF2D7|nr:DUF6292 family protein [Saccharothrix sp. NRRL B-16348]KOX24805.1 hypothetical protein ADK67_17800 [Saccharothrix sp. NRRL B-16348]
MDWEFDDDSAARALLAYVSKVTRALGLSGECSCVQSDGSRLGAYLALDGHLPGFADRDVALLWEEGRGWAVAVEADSAEPPFVLARLRGPVLPEPAAVARWVEGLDLVDDDRTLLAAR